jgi:hypothetical protein
VSAKASSASASHRIDYAALAPPATISNPLAAGKFRAIAIALNTRRRPPHLRALSIDDMGLPGVIC